MNCNCVRCKKAVPGNTIIWLGRSALTADPYCRDCAPKVALALPNPLPPPSNDELGIFGGMKRNP